MSKGRERLLATISVVVGALGCLMLAEIVLRFMPVPTSMYVLPVTPENPIYRFTPHLNFTSSRDWNLRLARHGRTNNDGWVNEQEYQKNDPIPLLAIIGDSYIEATAVPYLQTAQGRLAENLKGRLRVYSFAASGAPLSEYLMYAQYAVSKFKAEALVINVISNDFDESHISYYRQPGFWVYVADPKGNLQLKLIGFQPGITRTLLKQSALARYVLLNLHVKETLLNWTYNTRTNTGPKTGTDTDPKRLAVSIAVVDAFFRDLPQLTGLPPDRIAFTIDGFRYTDSALSQTGSYFDLMRRAFRERAEMHGYEVIDLDPLFFANYRLHHQRFDFLPIDGHWNAAGHAILAEAVMASRLLDRLQMSDNSAANSPSRNKGIQSLARGDADLERRKTIPEGHVGGRVEKD